MYIYIWYGVNTDTSIHILPIDNDVPKYAITPAAKITFFVDF